MPIKRFIEQERAKVAADYAAVGSKKVEPVRPPAEKEALTSEELNSLTSQIEAVEADAAKKLNALLPMLTPEDAASLRAQLNRADIDTDDFNNVVESAVQCLLKP